MNCFLNLSNLFGPSDIKCDLFYLDLILCVHVLNQIIGVITSLHTLCCCLLQDNLPLILKGQAVSDACANAQKNTICWVSIIYFQVYPLMVSPLMSRPAVWAVLKCSSGAVTSHMHPYLMLNMWWQNSLCASGTLVFVRRSCQKS